MSNYPPQGQAVATASIAFSAGVSTIGNTAGITGTVSREMILAGGNNVTLSQNIVGQSATITISAGVGIASHNSVYHTGTIGAESQISFDTLSGHDHDGSNSRLIITPEYIEVSKVEIGKSRKQFTSIKDAIDSITDNSNTKPYIIKVYPGVYNESPFTMKTNVGIEGTSFYNTIIQTNDNTNHFITGVARSYIRNASIDGPTNTNKAAFYYTGTGSTPFILQDILIRKGYYGIWANSVATGNIHIINVTNWYVGTAMHTFARATDHGIISAMNSGFMCGAPDAITKGFEVDGANAEIYLDVCYFRNTPSTKTIVGIYIDNGGHAKIVANTFSSGTYAIQIGPSLGNGIGGTVYSSACVIRNDDTYYFTKDIKIDNALASMDYNGIASRTKLDIVAGATFTGSFNDVTSGSEGTVNLGELYLGDLNNQLPLRDYGYTTYLTGQKTGGEVTTTGGLGIHVANGSGFINTSPTVNAVKSIAWLDANLNITTNTREWIYINSVGTVQKSNVEPDENINIVLAVAYANATDVIFLQAYTRKLQHIIGKSEEFVENIVGPIWVDGEGLDVIENVITPLRLDVSSGEYFLIFEEILPTGSSPITFTYWYQNGSGGWNTVPSSTTIDVTNYDNGSGILVAMTNGKYRKDTLYVTVNNNPSTTQYHIVYGQTQFDTQELAENGTNPTPPNFFTLYSLKLAGVIVQKSTTNINKILDIKPIAHYTPPGHNTLPGLQGGISSLSQYYHVNSTEYANLSQKIAAISGSNSSISGSTITFGNLNNISFYITNGSIVGSAEVIHSAVQRLNDSYGSISISGSQNISIANNASTISIYGPPNILNSFSISGNVGTTNSSNITGGGFVIAGGNDITLYQSNDTISISGRPPQTAIKSISAGTTRVTTGEVVFSNSNSVSFGADGQTITATVSYPDQSLQTQSIVRDVNIIGNTSGTATDITSGTLYLAGGNNITLSQVNNSITISAFEETVSRFSAGLSTLGNTVGTTGIASQQLIFAGGNNVTLSGSTNAGSMTITISAQSQSIQTQNLVDITIAGNTSGTLALISSGTLTLAGGNNITLSQDGNAVTISAFQEGITQFSVGVSNIGNTSGNTGTFDNLLVFAGGNNITLSQSIDGQSGTITISAYNQTIQTQGLIKDVNIIGNTSGTTADVTSGTLSLAGGDNITLSQNGNVITISAAAVGAGSFTAGMSNLGNTAGTTGVVNNRLVFAGGDNMTISQSIDGQSATMTFNFATIGAGSFTAGMSNLGNTSGTSGAVQNQLVFAGGNNVTLSQSKDGQSATLTISAFNQSVQTQNLIDVTLAGNTSGTLALISSGTLALAGGDNITLSQNANAITISAQSQSQQTQNIIRNIDIIGNTSGTTAHISSGTMSIAGGNNITLSQNQNSMTISANDALLAGMSNLGNTSGTTGLVYTQLVFAGGNNITLSQSVEALGLSATLTISAAQETATQFSLGVSNLGNSAGTTGTIDNRMVIVGGNNITLSQSIGTGTAASNATVTINAQSQSIQPGIQSLSAGTTNITTGEVVFANSNNISFGADGQTITATIHPQQTGISSIVASNTTYTSGQVQFTGSNMVTVKSDTDQMVIIDATQSVQTQNMHALVVSNNTSGLFTIGTSGTVSFAATNMTITANTANSSIVGFSIHPQQTGISGVQASDTTYTSGTVLITGVGGGITVSSNTNQRIDLSVSPQSIQTQNILSPLAIVGNTSGTNYTLTKGAYSLSAGANITLSQNSSNSNIIVVSAPDPVAAGIAAIGYTNVITGNNSQFTSGSVIFSGLTNITVNTSTTGNSQYIQLSVTNPGILSLFGGTTRATSGEVVFSNANNISFGINGQTMTATFSQSVQTQSTHAHIISGNTSGTTASMSTGTIVLAGGNNITLSQNGNAVTVSGKADPTLSYWGNANQTLLDVNTSASHRSFFLFPLNPQTDLFPGNMTVNTMYMLFDNVQGGMTNAHGKTLSIGIYTTTGISLSLINSASTTWGTAANNSAITSLFSGTRYLTIGTAQWSTQPIFSQGRYYLGMIADSSGSNIRMDMSGFRIVQSSGIVSGTIGIAMTSGNTSMGKMPWIGVSTDTRTNLPTTIGLSELVKTGGLYGFVPYIQFNNIQSNF